MKTPVFTTVLLVFLTALSQAAVAQSRTHATLLSLYAKSDAVMIGRYDKREEFGSNRVGEGFTVVGVKTSFDISTVLKGEPQKFVTVEDEEFRYQVQQGSEAPRDAVFGVTGDSKEADRQPRPGDTVLLFLNHQGDSFELADDADGVRKINPIDQAIYAQRIKELGSMMEKGKADPAGLAAWLVRCAEQPATRWDGAHELLQAFRQIEWRQEKDANGYERIDPSVSNAYGADVAKALSAEQKYALTQILVNSDFGLSTANSNMSDGDRELIALIKRWDPANAANNLLCQLKSRAFSSQENAGMMYKISELLGDAQAATLGRHYRELSSKENEVLTPNPVDPRSSTLDSFIKLVELRLAKAQAGSLN